MNNLVTIADFEHLVGLAHEAADPEDKAVLNHVLDLLEKLPMTADGAIVVPGMQIWWVEGNGRVESAPVEWRDPAYKVRGIDGGLEINDVGLAMFSCGYLIYSSQEAAQQSIRPEWG